MALSIKYHHRCPNHNILTLILKIFGTNVISILKHISEEVDSYVDIEELE